MKGFLKALVIFPLLWLSLHTGCATEPEFHQEFEEIRTDYPAQPRVQINEAGPLRVVEGLKWSEALGKDYVSPYSKNAFDERLGFFPGEGFRLATGWCEDCPVPEAALWYFRDEVIAVPGAERPISGRIPFTPGRGELPYPPLVWIGAPEIIEQATLSADGKTLHGPSGSVPFAIVPKIPTNRAYVNHSTATFFQGRPLRIRGATLIEGGAPIFIARTIWPEDTRIDTDGLMFDPLKERETFTTLIRAQTGGVTGIYAPRLLWERHPGQPRRWADRPVLAFVLDGAHGDDDGAHGGHLSIATGFFGPRGEWSNWLVSNFYPIDEKNEKGIIPALVPMDNYLMDLNSGQAYYRPNYMLVAVFRDLRVPQLVQTALQEVFHGYYCHKIKYDHATHNSTAMSIDTLRWLGWNIPRTGPTSYLAAIAAFPVAAVIQASLARGQEAFNLLTTEKTRLVPRVTFEVLGHDLLKLLDGDVPPRELTSFERMLAADVEAILFVHIPQVPSSRRFGTYPVASLIELGGRVPWDSDEWETAPDPGPWPFPQRLVDSCR